MTTRPLLTSRLVMGLAVLALGVLLTLGQRGWVDAGAVLRWWPVPVLVVGALALLAVGGRRRPVSGAILVIVALVAILHLAGAWTLSAGDLVPLFLVGAGVLLAARGWRGSPLRARLETDRAGGPAPGASAAAAPGAGAGSPAADRTARVDSFSLLAAMRRNVRSQAFEGGEVSVVLGAVTLDLLGARPAPGGAVLDMFVLWGGVLVIAPAGWRVVGRVTPLLGAYMDSTPPVSEPDAPVLELRGVAVMGGVEVRSDDPTVRVGSRVVRVSVGPGVHVGVSGRRRSHPGGGPAPGDAAD